MLRPLLGALLVGFFAVSAVPSVPNFLTDTSTTSNLYTQGSGVVEASSNQNYFDFRFTGTLGYGDQIGFYIFDSVKTAADVSTGNEYTCDASKAPLLTVSPSVLFNASAPNNLTTNVSPSRTEFFGGLAQGRYKLCYCKKPAVTDKNPSGVCRPADYKWSVGVFHFYNVPEVRQRKSVYANKTFNRFNFNINKDLQPNAQRVIIADLDSSFQSGFSKTRGCSTFTFGSTPAWSNGASSETTQKTQLKSVRKTQTYEEVAFHLPAAQVVTTPTPEGFYSVCLCDQTNIGTVNSISDCLTGCDTSGCASSGQAPVEIATVLVHDLSFLVQGDKIFSLGISAGSTQAIYFDYSKPTSIFDTTLNRKFFFARSSVACGQGDHTAASADMTIPQNLPYTGTVASVDFSSLSTGTVFDPYRMCLVVSNGEVVDLNNVVVVITDLQVTMNAVSLQDKISDNNQIGLQPLLTSSITGSKYQTGTNTNDPGLWLSDNFVSFTLTWNQSVSANDQLYAVRKGYPCSFPATATTDVWKGPSKPQRSFAHTVPLGVSSDTFVLDLGITLHNSTTTVLSTSPAAFDKIIKNTDVANTDLYTEYSLCATCAGCDQFGYDTGDRFEVLAALHVYNDDGFETGYRYSSGLLQRIIIASSVAVGTSPTPLFRASDELFFTSQVCSAAAASDYSGNTRSSNTQPGNTTVYKSQGNTVSMINAYEYYFSFTPGSQLDGKMVHLCVVRLESNSRKKYLDFPGCAVTVVPATQSPTVTQYYSTTTTVFAASPYSSGVFGDYQDFVLNAVLTDSTASTTFLQWKFTGQIQAEDRLSISSVANGVGQSGECGVSAYSFFSVVANTGGTVSASSGSFTTATSGNINGMIPGQYALCFCSTKTNDPTAVQPTCRTPRDFSQFVGYVFFRRVVRR
jgi:hypothetical protein